MSDEGGVMSFQVSCEGTLGRVTPIPGKGALDTRWLCGKRRHPDSELGKVLTRATRQGHRQTGSGWGVCMPAA